MSAARVLRSYLHKCGPVMGLKGRLPSSSSQDWQKSRPNVRVVGKEAFSTQAAAGKREPAGGSSLAKPDLRKLAQLAKVSLTEEQIEDFQPKVDRVVDWFAQLQEVDLEESEIQDFEVVDTAGRSELREDVPREYENREELLSQIPLMEGEYIKLPKTTTEG
ncbi:subunit C of glutamyl-tRNA(Gln) amidotransferase [Chloropicon primus]|uniref:Glutamyl-tRNA(Gln) amidotransferase subunit C, chloroplastic/mitochondrial n=2 Tax=Chloropicon primus TaxID=1764295 RepID=A0A5B8MKB6_9CHLO|nr:subunit C of glutamyl-tRNA(Gln) amidotransferase [Chloropicon primus]UPR00041.1 subunit C of glutamyl-tRNA(Gln) amidotransferase [Chloropicon primus]|eukprot:QDZ20829.1 subunit C of glutamyl-tRNA(Gln) amidotransferase [Chloropicon primus]